MLDEEPLFTPLTLKKIAENAQKSKEWVACVWMNDLVEYK
jgi:hypothetical protein